jgi:CheY-like chemotaxis protein
MENTTKRPTVIVADDNAAIHPLLCRILQCELDIVENVFDGQALVDATNCHRPDLVVVDVYMPVLDGIEALKQIHSRFPDLPAVLISTDAGEENMQRARLAGAYAIVEKGSAAERLLPAVQAALVGRRSGVNNF